jgi:hypothetical protein
METASEDDNFGTEQSCKSIISTFGSPGLTKQFAFSGYKGKIIVARQHLQQFFLTQGDVDFV